MNISLYYWLNITLKLDVRLQLIDSLSKLPIKTTDINKLGIIGTLISQSFVLQDNFKHTVVKSFSTTRTDLLSWNIR